MNANLDSIFYGWLLVKFDLVDFLYFENKLGKALKEES